MLYAGGVSTRSNKASWSGHVLDLDALHGKAASRGSGGLLRWDMLRVGKRPGHEGPTKEDRDGTLSRSRRARRECHVLRVGRVGQAGSTRRDRDEWQGAGGLPEAARREFA